MQNKILWKLLEDNNIVFDERFINILDKTKFNTFPDFLDSFNALFDRVKLSRSNAETTKNSLMKIESNFDYFVKEYGNRIKTDTASTSDKNTLNPTDDGVEKKLGISYVTEALLKKLEDDNYKDQLHKKLKNSITTFVFKYNNPSQIQSPVITIVNNRLLAKVECPECQGLLTIQSFVKKNMTVKWITGNISRHYKRHFIEFKSKCNVNQLKGPNVSDLQKSNGTELNAIEPEFTYFLDTDVKDYENDDDVKIKVLEKRPSTVESPAEKIKCDLEEDEDWLFCRSIWAMMKKMSNKAKNELKVELLSVTAAKQEEYE